MSCKLCDKPKKLQNSHIIPEFFYKDLYDDIGRAHRFWVNEKFPKSNIYEQKGLREKLLCKDCEGILNNQYEAQFSIFWYKKNNIPSNVSIDSITSIEFPQNLLAGLLISVVWRASICTGTYFKSIRLPKDEEEKIKLIIKEDLALNNFPEFKVTGSVITDESGNVIKDLIIPPVQTVANSHVFYTMIFGGIEWRIKTSEHEANEFSSLYMNESGLLNLSQKHWSESIANV